VEGVMGPRGSLGEGVTGEAGREVPVCLVGEVEME
jgi:hypothetical protein